MWTEVGFPSGFSPALVTTLRYSSESEQLTFRCMQRLIVGGAHLAWRGLDWHWKMNSQQDSRLLHHRRLKDDVSKL